MSRRKRPSPSEPRRFTDPAEDARVNGRDPATWGANDEAMQLPANADVETTADRSVAHIRRIRYDVFGLLLARKSLKDTSELAARRFQKDLAILHRTQGTVDAIRCTGRGSLGALAEIAEDFSLARAEAGDRIAEVLDGMKRSNATLIRALCEAEVVRGSPPNWHKIVRQMTGEIRDHKHGPIVIEACDDLAESYSRIDNAPKARVAA